jgi:hypothetical protein
LEDWQCGENNTCVPAEGTEDKPRIKIRPPPNYYNYGVDNKCYTTKDYCSAFESSYGKGSDWFVFNKCAETAASVDTKSDCCIDMGQSVGEFFLGKTLTRTGMRMMGYVYKIIGMLTQSSNMMIINEKNLTLDKVVSDDYVQGVPLGRYKWTDDNGQKSYALGFDMAKLSKAFPHEVVQHADGQWHVALDKPITADPRSFRKMSFALKHSKEILESITSAALQTVSPGS